MVALLAKITREADPLRNPYRNAEQVKLLRAQESLLTDPVQLFDLRKRLAWQLLEAGNPEEALKECDEIKRRMDDDHVLLDDKLEPEWLTFKALCWLRMGEQENCLINHNADSCLFPIRESGVHQLPRGSRGAVAVLTELLQKYPGDLRARWLLNIAYMTLGEYPDQVPSP